MTLNLILMAVLLARAVSASTHPVDGIWRGEGWGSVYEVHGTTLKAFEVTTTTCVRGFEVTTTTCVRGFEAERFSPENPGDSAAFRTRNGDVLKIVPDGDGEHKRIQRPTPD